SIDPREPRIHERHDLRRLAHNRTRPAAHRHPEHHRTHHLGDPLVTTDGTITLRSAARSHTGLVRKNNQDSGYAGPNFLLIADGMGGHAGGDVASAITVSRLAELDRE